MSSWIREWKIPNSLLLLFCLSFYLFLFIPQYLSHTNVTISMWAQWKTMLGSHFLCPANSYLGSWPSGWCYSEMGNSGKCLRYDRVIRQRISSLTNETHSSRLSLGDTVKLSCLWTRAETLPVISSLNSQLWHLQEMHWF